MTVNENFFKWLDKLKSGDIEKGVGGLHKIHLDGEGNEVSQMCCLGVCSSMFAEDLNISVVRTGLSIAYGGKGHYPDKNVLLHMGIPESHIVERSIGATVFVSTPNNARDRIGEEYYDNGRVGVDVLNDNYYTHSEIADLLRKEFAPETVEV